LSVASPVFAAEASLTARIPCQNESLFHFGAKAAMSPVDEIPQRISRIVPLVYWEAIFENFLAARDRTLKIPSELPFTVFTDRP
jgi:hypothetical protein